jgi:hypothetical protein
MVDSVMDGYRAALARRLSSPAVDAAEKAPSIP